MKIYEPVNHLDQRVDQALSTSSDTKKGWLQHDQAKLNQAYPSAHRCKIN